MHCRSRSILASVVSLTLVACSGGAIPTGPHEVPAEAISADRRADFARTVIDPSSPLSLHNSRSEEVTWPVWGAVLMGSTGDALRVALGDETSAETGIAFVGSEDPDESTVAEIVRVGDGWVLRERFGGQVERETPIASSEAVELVVKVAADRRSVEVLVGDESRAISFARPLAPTDDGVGVYVHMAPHGQLVLDELAVRDGLPIFDGLGAPLRELAIAHDLSIGTAIDVWPPRHDPGFETLLGQQFDTAALTELYWTTTHSERDTYFFLPADLMMNYAARHGQAAHGYFLVWDFELPDWVENLAETGGAEALGWAFDDHIRTLVERYRGRIGAWVVVNEAIWGPDETGDEAQLADNVWLGTLGPGYIERAFHTARVADPEAVLLYNETGAEALGPKSDFMFELAQDFVERAVPIDAIGLQFHIDALAPPDMSMVKANMERFGALGLDVYITELDVSLANLGAQNAEALDRQAAIYRDVLDTCLAVAACRSYTVFGFSDRYAWDELGDASPLLMDDSYVPKPAYRAIHSRLSVTPNR